MRRLVALLGGAHLARLAEGQRCTAGLLTTGGVRPGVLVAEARGAQRAACVITPIDSPIERGANEAAYVRKQESHLTYLRPSENLVHRARLAEGMTTLDVESFRT